MFEEFGFSNPEQFFAKYLAACASATSSSPARFLSLGAGNCDIEVTVARLMRRGGLEQFTIDCLEQNRIMLDRGRALAAESELSGHLRFVEADFNRWTALERYHGVMANQSLHHVLRLEHLFDTVAAALEPNGLFVISDIIGRNGHMRWPEALERVEAFWQELPESYHYNVQLRRQEKRYINWDCSRAGFEGIRAQDIVSELLAHFHFELFIGFGNVIDVFVDRSFGHNFDASSADDRAFVDRVHAEDELLIARGELTPTHMLAVVSQRLNAPTRVSRGITPRAAIHPSLRHRGRTRETLPSR